mmetsp:Transcript_36523/g.58895  ORF Transcript_36523/g.58895 Transcript_36523/m.58895 type:complete len:1553 (+) Transcript_36523:88-4746(+)
MATELNSLMNECVEAFPATSPFAVCLSLALRVYGADTPTELDKSQTCDLFNLVGGCYNGNKGSSSVAACEQLEDLGDHYCESEFVANVWGISLLLLLILWLVLVLTCFRHTSHGALVKKNLRILRTVLLRTILGGFFSLIIIGVLVFVVLYFTHTTPLTIDLASPVGGVSYPFVTPFRENDQFRKFLFQTIRPFGGLLILIVFTQSISMIIIGFVHEKETRMKELLRISGMGSLGYYFSFVLTFIIQFLPLCIALACLTKYGQIFPNQTLSELSFFFMSFLFSYIGFSQCIATFFKTSRIAALVNVMLAYVLYLLSFNLLSSPAQTKNGYCFVPSLCLAFGVDYMFQSSYMVFGVDVNTGQHPNPLECSLLMVTWGFVYALLAWYLEYVVPQQNGVRKHPLFFVAVIKTHVKTFVARVTCKNDAVHMANEESPESRCIEMIDTRKVFKVKSLENKERVAVDGLSLRVENSTLMVLLGENGAGKSTTFDMLTGMTEPTSGDIKIHGYSVRTHIHKIRKFVGFVPQKNVIYPELNVRQHLQLICSLRSGTAFRENDVDTVELLQDLDLLKKIDTHAGNLSGGQKRKLALAMALIGETKVLFLDEVSSGVDPDSRRGFWKLLRKYRRDRIIVCTTHFLDEAEFLADKIAILSKGKLQCYDTNANLKQRYGDGNRLIISSDHFSLDQTEESAQIAHLVTTRIPGAIQEKHFGGMCFKTPFVATEQCAQVINILEKAPYNCLVRFEFPTLEEVFLKLLGSGEAETAAIHGQGTDATLLQKPTKPSGRRVFGAMVWKRFRCAMKEWPLWSGLMILAIVLGAVPILTGEIQLGSILQTGQTPKTASPDCVPAIRSTDCCEFGANTKECMADGKPQCVHQANSILSKCKDSFSFCEKAPWICKVETCCSFTTTDSAIYTCYYNIDINNNLALTGSCPVYEVAKIQGFINSLYQAIVVLMGLAFCIAPIMSFAVMETETHRNTKFLQYVSGVGPFAYWMGSYIWDQLFLLTTGVVLACLQFFYSGLMTKYIAVSFVAGIEILVFVFSMIPWTYAMSFGYKDHARAIIFSIVFVLCTGVGLGIIASLLFQLNIPIGGTTSADIVVYASYLLNIFPAYAIVSGLTLTQQKFYVNDMTLDTSDLYVDALVRIIYMAGTGLIMWIILAVRESRAKEDAGCCSSSWKGYSSRLSTLGDHDDLNKERQRMEQARTSDLVQVRSLSKGYNKDKLLSLDDVSFGVRRGECFGYLGANGAGKTTTLSILSGRTRATNGRTVLNGIDVEQETVKARKHLGYCTQFDNLFSHLSVAEHLYLFATIHGYSNVNQVVDSSIARMNLFDYRNVQSRQLSGGNKRKLSCALILLGAPEVVVLDEPSTGLDPVSQRFLWNVITSVRKEVEASVILTSHSFVEVDALCDRLAVLVEGKLRCIGTSTYLTHKHGKCYRIKIAIGNEGTHITDTTQLVAIALNEHYGENSAEICDVRQTEATIELSKHTHNISVGNLMDVMNNVARSADVTLFSISESDLDEIFSSWVDTVKHEFDPIQKKPAYGLEIPQESTTVSLENV